LDDQFDVFHDFGALGFVGGGHLVVLGWRKTPL
jgi:hypothetical protein